MDRFERIEIEGVVNRMTIVELGVNNMRTAYIGVCTGPGEGGEKEYKVSAEESGRMPDFDEIGPGTRVRVGGVLKQNGRTIMAYNIEII